MRVYFYCVPTENARQVPYQHLALCLAEGFQALEIPCHANVNYWPLDAARDRHRLEYDPDVVPNDCDLVIVSDDWFTFGGRSMPKDMFRADRPYVTVALDRQDGSRLVTLRSEFRAFDFILRTHYNESTRYPSNFRPWAYGITERIADAMAGAPAFSARRKAILANWRHTAHPHSVRRAAERVFLPRIASVLAVDASSDTPDSPPDGAYQNVLWRETGRRHWPAYYRRLQESAASACFGGFFVTRRPANKNGLVSGALRRVLARTGWQSSLISQWDSWRLWESFAGGCATFHADLQRYGCVFPEPPLNGVHYLGIDLRNVDATIASLLDDPGLLERVACNGRDWALAAYGPRPTAVRLLRLIEGA